ncbi:hypothetical protein ACTFIY_003343 [Dictyostelium cf. discoideum]
MIYTCFSYNHDLKGEKNLEIDKYNKLLILKGYFKSKTTQEKRNKANSTIKSLFEEKLKEIELINGNIDYILVLPGHRIGYSTFQYSINKFYENDIEQQQPQQQQQLPEIPNQQEIKKKLLYVKRIKQTEQQKKEGFRSKLSDKEEIKSVLLPMELNNKFNLEGKSILLLDDATTTGRTLKTYEKNLKKLCNNNNINIKIIKLAIAKTI